MPLNLPVAPRTPPVFQYIAIVGLGCLGASLGLAARQRWPAAIVIGVDDHEHLEQAIRAHAVDVASPDLSILSGAELVILTGSPERNASVLARLPDQVEGPAVVTGINGEDDSPAATVLPARLAFVTGRPSLEAGRQAGAAAALVNDLTWRLGPPGTSPAEAEAHRRLGDFLAALGVDVQAAG
jgi:cyclohexadieny/prephenate dehydrogenase